jgi:hypothetical protein
VGNKTTLKRGPVTEEMTVYRVVATDSRDPKELEPSFRSERTMGAVPETDREYKYPELLDGICADKKAEQAAERCYGMCAAAEREGREVERGSFVATLIVRPAEGFEYEDRKKRDGKVTIWGDSAKLAGAVCRVDLPDLVSGGEE